MPPREFRSLSTHAALGTETDVGTTHTHHTPPLYARTRDRRRVPVTPVPAQDAAVPVSLAVRLDSLALFVLPASVVPS